MLLSVKSDDKDTMTKFLDQLISNHNDTGSFVEIYVIN